MVNFELLISLCQNYGTQYNPIKPGLQLPALLSLQQQAVNAIQSTKVSKAALDNAINDRRNAFADLKSVSTKIINALTVSGTTSLAVDDAKTINRKIQGIRASKKSVTAKGF